MTSKELLEIRAKQCVSEATAFLNLLKSQGIAVPQSLHESVEAVKEALVADEPKKETK